MKYLTPIYGRKRWLVLGLLSLALVALLIVAACGESATATPEAGGGNARAYADSDDGGRAG